ncbi:capsular biosynthesis protein [Roseomonas sp. BN140053]|uniref:capsular polysaccharide export protein, LipB/KpsS family n=1 Tax=Roseomonas sp. BN140053 TaxID=3391898 RepID=UPI0039E91B61
MPQGWSGPVQPISFRPLEPSAFAGRAAPPVLFAPGAPPPGAEDRRDAAAFLVSHRLGGPPGLPDPGAAALGLPPQRAVLALSAVAAAAAVAEGQRVLLWRDPWSDRAPDPVPGARLVAERVSPWTLLDAASEVRGAGRAMALLARLAGLPCADAPEASLAEARCADPFRHRPWSLGEALELLVHWRAQAAENARITVCLGVARWKRAHVSALLGHDAGGPRFARSAPAALAAARQAGGAVAVWSSRERPGLRGQGVPVLALEDGFLRSRGIGARFLPGASYCLDAKAAYYDPRSPSALEDLLRDGVSDSDTLRRAAALRAAIVERGIGKYHLSGEAPALSAPPGRRVVLVPGQVEDDASVILGGGAIRSNLALLRAVRAAEPEAFLVYKPHPDLEAGFRRGRIAAQDLMAVADQVVTGASLSALFPVVDALHTLTSLSGFEALLRGLPVTTWGRPFYAGWGLTTDRAPEGFPPGRRNLPRSLDALVAATLILYPRYLDPVTLLPCTPELILERLDDPDAWRLSPLTLHRGLEGQLRRWWSRLAGWR